LAGEEVLSLVGDEIPSVYRAPEKNEFHCVTLRQLAIDDIIMDHCARSKSLGDSEEDDARHVVKQVVVVGAGMDTRAYRLHLPHVHWIEVDMPEVIALKEQWMSQAPPSLSTATELKVKQMTRIPLRLGDESVNLTEVLESHGHDASAPTLYLM
jgi:O-methyltransferase involved in polyketide biosynthesis